MVWLKSVSSSPLTPSVVISQQTVDYITLPRVKVVIDENQFIHCDLLPDVDEIFKQLIQLLVRSTSSSYLTSNSFQVKGDKQSKYHHFTFKCVYFLSSLFNSHINFNWIKLYHSTVRPSSIDDLFTLKLIASGDCKQQSTHDRQVITSPIHQSDLSECGGSIVSSSSLFLSTVRVERVEVSSLLSSPPAKESGSIVGGDNEIPSKALKNRLNSKSELTCQDLIT